MQHFDLTSIVPHSRGAGKFDFLPDPLIDSVVSFVTKSSKEMSDNEVDDVSPNNLIGEFDHLNLMWECDALNVIVQRDNADKTTTGWMCAYYPCPHSIGGPVVRKTVNATKALAHLMKLLGNDVTLCQGNIPFTKQRQYQEFYNRTLLLRKQKKVAKSYCNRNIEDHQKAAMEGSTILPSHKRGANVGESPCSTFSGSLTLASTGRTSASTVAGNGLAYPMNQNKVARGFVNHFDVPKVQLKLASAGNTNSVDPLANDHMHIAIIDFIISNALPFSLVDCMQFCIMVGIARNLGPTYVFPDPHIVSGPLLDVLFDSSNKQQMNTLLLESKIFGNTLFGGGAIMGKVPLINILGAGPNNATALVAICNCTAQMECGGRKDAEYIAKLILPEIQKMEDKLVNTIRSILE